MKKFINALVLIAVIAGIYYALELVRKNDNQVTKAEVIRPVKTISIRSRGKGGVWNYYGTLQGGRRVDLSFRVSGPINSIKVDRGTRVKKGALLASLDPRDYQNRLKQARSTHAQAQAQYNDAEANFKRYENLYKERVVPKSTYDTYKTQMDVASSALSAAKASMEIVQDSLKDTELRAPFDGVIVDRLVENFQDVTAKQTIFRLQDLSSLEIVFNVPENDILWASKAGRNPDVILAKFDAIPDKTFPLALKEVILQADRSTNSFAFTASMPKQDGIPLLPGMSAVVEMEYYDDQVSDEDLLYIVPETAIVSDETMGEYFVWRYENGAVRRVAVNSGMPRNNGSIEISGASLMNGDNIIVAGAHLLHEGQRVRLME